MAISPTFGVYIDWGNNGTFVGVNEDVTTKVLSVSVSRGRQNVNDDFGAGSCAIVLKNTAGLYSPFNASGALYGSILPGRAVKVEVTVSAIAYPVFYGYIGEYEEGVDAHNAPTVTVHALDGFDALRFGDLRLALQESQRVDQLITTILDAAAWSATLRDLDTANETCDFFVVHHKNPLESLKVAAKQELGGQLFMARDGKVTFVERFERSRATSIGTITPTSIDGLVVRREDLYDEVQHQYASLKHEATTQNIYQRTGGTGLRLEPGSTSPYNTLAGAFSINAAAAVDSGEGVGAKSVLTPVAVTDYVANSAADGGGTDKTAQVTVASFTAYAGGFVVTFSNADSSDVYLTTLKVRGQPIRYSNDERLVTVAASSPVVTEQTLSDRFDFNNNVAGIKSYAQFRAAVFSALQPRPSVRIMPDTDAELAVILNAELGSRCRLTNTSGMYPSQIDEFFYIEGIQIALAPGPYIEARWQLMHEDQAAGTFFRISGAAGGGADYSTIATAAPTFGDHRIAW